MIFGAILALVAKQAYGAESKVEASVALTKENCLTTIKYCKCK